MPSWCFFSDCMVFWGNPSYSPITTGITTDAPLPQTWGLKVRCSPNDHRTIFPYNKANPEAKFVWTIALKWGRRSINWWASMISKYPQEKPKTNLVSLPLGTKPLPKKEHPLACIGVVISHGMAHYKDAHSILGAFRKKRLDLAGRLKGEVGGGDETRHSMGLVYLPTCTVHLSQM